MGFLLRILGWMIYLLPNRARIGLGNGLGRILERAKFKSAVIQENLAYAFPTEAQTRERIGHQAYLHFGNLVLELILLFGPLRRFVKRNSDLAGANLLHEALRSGRGAILLASHVGNWEIMAGTGAALENFDILIVTKHLKPEWLHVAVEKARRRLGVRATYEPKTLKDVLRQLKSGKTVGFVLDQYAGAPVGVRVPVFGIPVGTMTAVAMLAKRTGAPVLPVVNFHTPNGRIRSEVHSPLKWISDPDPHQELAINTANYAKVLERFIYTHPDQWLWMHRRWKTRPAGEQGVY